MSKKVHMLRDAFNHIVLPPQLPNGADQDGVAVECELLCILRDAAARLLASMEEAERDEAEEKDGNGKDVDGDEEEEEGHEEDDGDGDDNVSEDERDGEDAPRLISTLQFALELVDALIDTHATSIKPNILAEDLCKVPNGVPLVLHLREQNAGLIVRPSYFGPNQAPSTIIFEAFEASPISSDVIAAKNRLVWAFPDTAASISVKEFANKSFQCSLVDYISQGSTKALTPFTAKTTKAGTERTETRETNDPGFVTGILMTVIESIGQAEEVEISEKRVRDDVMWRSSLHPWRRSPFWLVVRVSLHRLLGYQSKCGQNGRVIYKFLMATMVAEFLNESINRTFPPQLIDLTAKKLSRRLGKLEAERAASSDDSLDRSLYDRLFAATENRFQDVLRHSQNAVQRSQEAFRKTVQRVIPTLPLRPRQDEQQLSLPNSRKILDGILNDSIGRAAQEKGEVNLPMDLELAVTSVSGLTRQLHEMVDIEFQPAPNMNPSLTKKGAERQTISVAKLIYNYLNRISLYENNREQLSLTILVALELWVEMDRHAIRACPLLKNYRPVFLPEALDFLQLPTLGLIRRLNSLQEYLDSRVSECLHEQTTIFSDPSVTSFATTYVASDPDGARIRQIWTDVWAASLNARERKRLELTETMKVWAEHDREASCMCTWPYRKCRSRCHACSHRKARDSLQILLHEDYLPNGPNTGCPASMAIVFELGIPEYLSYYREATWKLLTTLACPRRPDARPPVLWLNGFKQLQPWLKSSVDYQITLAATSAKSWTKSHYNQPEHLPIYDESKILLPLAAKFCYYIKSLDCSPSRLTLNPTFRHLAGLDIPQSLNILLDGTAATDGLWQTRDDPSSYQVIAHQTECPSDMSVHMYMAIQRLLPGTDKRWIVLLVELGASNIDFGRLDVMELTCQLAIQAGPRGNGEIRSLNYVFTDLDFCLRLTEQLNQRLEVISNSWKETKQMELILTLALRMYTLSSRSAHVALSIIEKARSICLRWLMALQKETIVCRDSTAATSFAQSAMISALLCRRSFEIHLDGGIPIMRPDELCAFVAASIGLNNNFEISYNSLNPWVKRMVVRDVKMVYRLQHKLESAVERYPEQLEEGIRVFWIDNANCQRYSKWQRRCDHPGWNKWWFESRTEGGNLRSLVIHLNMLDGRMLVQGIPVGQLPNDIQQSPAIQELFPNRHLRVYTSPEDCMLYVDGWEVHIGKRNHAVVIRAWRYGNGALEGPFEYVSRDTFRDNNGKVDMPLPLLNDYVHWMDLNTRKLEMRHRSEPWKRSESDWVLDLKTAKAQRGTGTLVDPKSGFYKSVSSIFEGFIDCRELVVFTPETGPAQISLEKLGLTFNVTDAGYLRCLQLGAIVDPDQDAGTLYGFRSMIVMRDVVNAERRDVIFPIGRITHTLYKDGVHTVVHSENAGIYGRFSIDTLLGRLSCPPELTLLYTKALLHALTSHILPDRLTGRTGAEESLHLLQSPMCQPWVPLSDRQIRLLHQIAALSPRREYYPEHLQVMQKVIWDSEATASALLDSYRAVVNSIIEESQRLVSFHPRAVALDAVTERGHLRHRGEIQRLRFQRAGGTRHGVKFHGVPDDAYTPRYHRDDRFRTTAKKAVDTLCRTPFIITQFTLQSILNHAHEPPPPRPRLNDIGDILEAESFARRWEFIEHFRRLDRTQAIFFIALISLRADMPSDMISLLAAYARLPSFKSLPAPDFQPLRRFEYQAAPSTESLSVAMKGAHVPFNVKSMPKELRGDAREVATARREWESRCSRECTAIANSVMEQWPCARPAYDPLPKPNKWLLEDNARSLCTNEWQDTYQHHLLTCHVDRLQLLLQRAFGSMPKCPRIDPSTASILSFRPHGVEHVSTLALESLIEKKGPGLSSGQSSPSTNQIAVSSHSVTEGSHEPPEIDELRGILTRHHHAASGDQLRTKYFSDLLESTDATATDKKELDQETHTLTGSTLEDARQVTIQLHAQLCSNWGMLEECFAKGDRSSLWLKWTNLWPCITRVTVLEQLRTTVEVSFDPDMRHAVVTMGINITKVQRQLRITDAVLRQNTQKCDDELKNTGHTNWSPLKMPDWLLLEIDGDILIRPDQVEVARATIRPEPYSNSVLQMNMGKGKTSCIVPMAVTALADGNRLCRLVVPMALLAQTAQAIQPKLSGLVGRRLSHIPFSRAIGSQSDEKCMAHYENVHWGTLSSRGVMLTTPEHILSFKLSGLQRLADGNYKQGRRMIYFHEWTTQNARDILDESDHTLAVKTQLTYPSGSQLPVDGHPHRWFTAEQVLEKVRDHISALRGRYPESIEIIDRPAGGFPIIYLLRQDVEDALVEAIIDDVVEGRSSILRAAHTAVRFDSDRLRRIITGSEEVATVGEIEDASQQLQNPTQAAKQLMLLRGLLKYKVLLLCLKKRWNVQYGLAQGRVPLAVPYDAKGIPSEQAEFGHPDVAIMLTCLAFYYTGLSLAQMKQSLGTILQSRDPASTYDQWISGYESALPPSLRQWNVINLDDDKQLEWLWHHVRYTMTVIDHFLNLAVFPIHSKQFTLKLQTSAWDVPLAPSIQDKDIDDPTLTTGFSGTNDDRSMLPLTIRQRDLPSLRQTSAEVLAYLLQSRNRGYAVVADIYSGRRLSERALLERLSNEGICILIDCGATIIEMSNSDLINEWLKVDTKASAAVYFDRENKAQVRYRRGGADVPLVASLFAENLDGCLVYLDEAHTRGIDMKFPREARGAITLGLGQTKDHTVQAAMRLRQLGTTQSVMLWAPPEVDRSIRQTCGIGEDDTVSSPHVISWLLEQTCRGNEQLRALYHAQGRDFLRRANASCVYADNSPDEDEAAGYIDAIIQPEHQTLAEMYCNSRYKQSLEHSVEERYVSDVLISYADKLGEIHQASSSSDYAHASQAALEEVEQEREAEIQVEEERSVEKPPLWEAYHYPGLNATIQHFVEGDGTLCAVGQDVLQAFDALGRTTTVGRTFAVRAPERSPRLYVSKEWTKSIIQSGAKRRLTKNMDAFIRGVDWIVLCPSTDTALVVIAEEADDILRILRREHSNNKQKAPLVHLIAYSAPVTRSMNHFSTLRYYAFPALPATYSPSPHLMLDLGILAGRLYFEFGEYERLREYLRGRNTQGNSSSNDGSQGDSSSSSEQSLGLQAMFSSKSREFVTEWLGVCRKGQDVVHTPMGYLLQGRVLRREDGFFARECAPIEVFSNPGQLPAERDGFMTAITKIISSIKLPVSKGPVKLTPDQAKNPMAVTGSVTLYRYAISFPEDKRSKYQVEPKGKKRRRLVELLIEDHLNDKSYSLASDYSAILISKTKLPIKPDGTLFSIVYRGDNEDKPDPKVQPDPDEKPAPTYHLLLQLTQDHSISEIINSITSTNVGDILSDRRLEIIQSLNIIIRSYAKANPNIATTIGPNRHYMLNPAAEDTWSIPNGLVALRGFFFSVRAASAQLLLNVQVKSAAFYQSGPLDIVMLDFLGGRRVSDAVIELTRYVNGLSIYVTHLPVKKNKAGQPIRRIKRIQGLAAKGDGRGNKDKEPPKVDAFGATASQVQFFQKPPEGKQGNGNWITVRKYFDKEYKKQINWNRVDLPVINVGTAQNPSYLPAEVCVVVPGQQVNAMLKGPQTEGMRSQAVRQPAWNAKSIVGAGAKTLGLDGNKVLSAFGISINTNLITVEARVLPAPRPLYLGGKAPSKVANGGWNMANIKSYRNGILPGSKCTGLEFDCPPGFLANNIREGGMLGFIQKHQLTWIDAPNQCNIRSDDPEAAIEKWAQAAYRTGVRVLIVLLPLQETNIIFNMVKRVCDVIIGIHSVCVRHDKVRTLQAPRSVQYWANVDLKLNLKLGGVNQYLDKSELGIIAEGNTMVIGLDVTHPSSGSAKNAPSVAALVASIGPDLGQFPAQIRVQTGRQERVANLDDLMVPALRRWKKHNGGHLPENVLICRNGVSEGQYAIVRDFELADLRKACASVYPVDRTKQGFPRFTVVVVGKRHNTRFYPASTDQQDNGGNPANGTVVDRGVTELLCWDFFLQAHAPPQGTARPAHYYVIYDDIFRRHGVPANQNAKGFSHAADAFESLMHNMSYLYGRATRAVSICPPAYYADIACERARCYLSELFEPSDVASVTSTAGSAGSGDFTAIKTKTTIHPNLANSMFYI